MESFKQSHLKSNSGSQMLSRDVFSLFQSPALVEIDVCKAYNLENEDKRAGAKQDLKNINKDMLKAQKLIAER